MKAASYLCLMLLLAPLAGSAQISHSLRDTAARIDYGFYTEDASLIQAARESIDVSGDGAWSSYLTSYAAYRQAQVTVRYARPAAQLLDSCLKAAEVAAESPDTAVEATILIAACSALAAQDEPVRAVLHQRRFRRAMNQAAEIEPQNPRLLLIAMTSPLADAALQPDPETVLHAFRLRAESFAFPDWGEAEALMAAGAARLAAGDRRGARDLAEAALLNAPDYIAARRLADRISGLSTTH